MTIQLKVDGMSCGHCVRAVKEALEGVDGVNSAEVDLDKGSAQIDAAETIEAGKLIAAIQEEGYEARLA